MRALVISELKRRIRGRRWWIVLLSWTLLLAAVVAAVRGAARHALEFAPPTATEFVGSAMFAALALLTLALGSLVVPALTATAINGERDRGTLATLQATLLRPWEIVLAKFVAAWVASAAFLAATIPLALWSVLEGGVGAGRAVVVYAVLLLLTAVLAALGLAASALVSRPALSTVTAYGIVFFLTILTPVFFGLAVLTAPEVAHPQARHTTVKQIGLRWVILAPNPFVVLADAAPRAPHRDLPDPLETFRVAIRYARGPSYEGARRGEGPPLWPTGLTIDVALGAGALLLSSRRLRVPARKLGRGERVA